MAGTFASSRYHSNQFFFAVFMIRAASIIRAKQKENSDSVDSVLWQNTKLPEKKIPEGNFEVLLYLHG
jgi:hypothetical protein